MPPKAKFTKREIVEAATKIAEKSGIAAVTAREVGAALGVSSRPLFTYFDSVDDLKKEVYLFAKELYRKYIERGLNDEIPFLGIWKQYIRFAKEKPELYKLLFLTPPGSVSGGAMEALKLSQELSRESLMKIYNMDSKRADSYFRDMWLVAFSFATLIVTNDCPYTEEEMFAVGTEISLSICKAYKEIPGLAEGRFDRDKIFRELVNKKTL